MVLQPSLAAMARQQERQRTRPPPVPPLLTQSHFDSVEAYKDYMRTRRKAQERLREFNRPARERRAAVKQPTAASLEGSEDEWYLRARRIEAGYELRDAKAAAAEWLLSQKSCAQCGQVLPQWTRGWDRCECSTV